jgi:hypothetical protein
VHNPLYFPENVVNLTFDYDVTIASDDDELEVLVGGVSVEVISLDSLGGEIGHLTPSIADFRGTVNTIEFRLNIGGVLFGFDSEIFIDNVNLVLAAPTSNADFNSSGLVTGADFLSWQRGHGTVFGASHAGGDADGDHDVDGKDLNIWKNQYRTIPAPFDADFDSDGDIDGSDFLTWQRGVGVGTTLAEGDANGNGAVDGDDLTVWQNQYGTASAPLAAMTAEDSLEVDASFSESQSLAASALSADLVDVALAVELSSRPTSNSRSSQAAVHEDRIDWPAAALQWREPHLGQNMSKTATNGRQGHTLASNRYQEADAAYEDLLDELFSEEVLVAL